MSRSSSLDLSPWEPKAFRTHVELQSDSRRGDISPHTDHEQQSWALCRGLQKPNEQRAQPGWRIPPDAARRKNLAPAPALPPFGGRILGTFKVSSGLGWDAQIMSSLHEEFWDVILKSSWLNTLLHLSHQCKEEACLHMVGAGYWNPPQPGVRTRGDVGMTAETQSQY